MVNPKRKALKKVHKKRPKKEDPRTIDRRANKFMLLVLVALALVVLAAIIVPRIANSSEATKVGNSEEPSKAGWRWIRDAGWAFAEMVKQESPKVWYDCGVITPQGEWHARGREIAEQTLRAMKRDGLKVDPTGVLAVAYIESRGNRCSIGPRTRAGAKSLGLAPEGKNWRTYNKEDILAILDNPKWKDRGRVADVGIYQDVFPRYARILDDGGSLKCVGPMRLPCRLPTTEELLTTKGSAQVGVHGMITRQYHFRTREPWIYWPWTTKLNYTKAVLGTKAKLEGLIKKARSA
jgi:hypothetical protein